MAGKVFIAAILTATVFALVPAAGASAADPFWECRSSVLRASVLPDALPSVEPLSANDNLAPCADGDQAIPTIAIPPAPSPAVITTDTVFARTDVLCAGDDADPTVTPANNDDCDAGFGPDEQRVVARAGAENLVVTVPGLSLTADAIDSTVAASCVNGMPSITSSSTVVNLIVNGNPVVIPPGDDPIVIDQIPGVTIVLKERIGNPDGPQAGPAGSTTRRALRVTVEGGGSTILDLVLGEAIAGYDSNVCAPTPPICPEGSTPNDQGICVINSTDCPAGTVKNPQNQCILTNVRCPDNTIFNPLSLSCIAIATGGRTVLLGDVQGYATSPCKTSGRFGLAIAVVGTDGVDRITGTNRSDRIFSFGGNDRVSGGRGDDCIEGGSGNDVLDGSNGNDYLLGDTGRDRLNGGVGDDRLEGGSGRDKLNGGYGNDRLLGGTGNDGIHTGNGRDIVNSGSGNDVINAATRGPAARVNCGPGKKDRVRINNNELKRTRGCEFVDVFKRIKQNNKRTKTR